MSHKKTENLIIQKKATQMKGEILTRDPSSSPSALTYGEYSSHSPAELS